MSPTTDILVRCGLSETDLGESRHLVLEQTDRREGKLTAIIGHVNHVHFAAEYLCGNLSFF